MNNKSALHVIALLFLVGYASYGQFQNFMLFQSNYNQIEPAIVRHPSNPQLLFASSYTLLSGLRNEGVYVSTNGGLNWSGSDIVVGTPLQSHGGDPGPIIDKNGLFILTHQGGFVAGMYSNYSSNQGSTWLTTAAPIAQNDQDKGSPQTDDAPSSPHYGRTYLVWTRYVSPFPIVISYTDNGAVTWTPLSQINNPPSGKISQGAACSISPNGTVYVTWASAINVSPNTEDCLGFARSTNGGLNWSLQECAIDCNGIRTSQLSPWTIRANSFPTMDVDKTGGARNGWIYIATTDKNLAPAGSDPDVIFHRSTDEGNTWSAGVRVNLDPLNNGRNQFFPAIRVDEDGGVNIVYYDSRDAADSVDIYLSRSVNGGDSWSNYRVTDRRFRPVPVLGTGTGIMGDNIGMTSGNGNLYPVWMSNKPDGIFHIWCAIINYNTIGIQQIGTEIPKEFYLSQNYPNPFNPSTKIEFSIPESGYTTLKIYNLTGMLVSTLAEQELSPGVYSANWNASDYSSGIYILRIVSGSYSMSRKMILIK